MNSEIIRECCAKGMTDASIGLLLGMTGEGVAYRRKKIGIERSDKYNPTAEARRILQSTPDDILLSDYRSLTKEKFSAKYGVSTTIWRPILKERGLFGDKAYPPLTIEQRRVIIGGLLGDGSVSQGDYYYESHAVNQRQYLCRKHEILKPYSSELYPVDKGTGLRFKTVRNPVFREFYSHFYAPGKKGKLLPLEYLADNWHDDLLAYWYFDDGSLDDVTGEISIANKAPEGQLKALLPFLESRYGWGFHCGPAGAVDRLTFSKKHYREFVTILHSVATPDVYYKFPEKYLTREMVEKTTEVLPKFYRLLGSNRQKAMVEELVGAFVRDGFPMPMLTSGRKRYLEDLTGERAKFRLYEVSHPEMYDSVRAKWGDVSFLRGVTIRLLSDGYRINGSSIRQACTYGQ